MHRALEILQAIEAAIVSSATVYLAPLGFKPDDTSIVISYAELIPEGDPAGPENLQRATWNLVVACDFYIYELETNALTRLFELVSDAHRAVMADGPGGTYAALNYVRGAWLGDLTEAEYDTSTEKSMAFARQSFRVDFSSDPTDPEL